MLKDIPQVQPDYPIGFLSPRMQVLQTQVVHMLQGPTGAI
jgi:hypothetical protein